MDEPQNPTEQPPSERATRLELGVLHWLVAAEAPDRFAPETLRAALGVELSPLGDSPGLYWHGDALTPAWRYGLLLDRSRPAPRLELDFRPSAGNDPSMREIAAVDLEAASSRLLEAGFQRDTVRAEHGRIDHHRFRRDALTVEIYARGESAANPERQCIRLLVAR